MHTMCAAHPAAAALAQASKLVDETDAKLQPPLKTSSVLLCACFAYRRELGLRLESRSTPEIDVVGDFIVVH